jgi:DNA-directed RNA polymerase beta subunit
MLLSVLKLYRPVKDVRVPIGGIDGKHICLAYVGENVPFLDAYRFLNIKPAFVKRIFVPRVQRPVRTYLHPIYKRLLMAHKLLPKTGLFGDFSTVGNNNFFLDYTAQTEGLIKRFKIGRYNDNRSAKFLNPLLTTLSGVPKDEFQRILLYTVTVDSPIPKKIFNKKVYLLYRMLLDWKKDPENTELPFDKILMFIYGSKVGGKYILLFDKDNPRNNIARVKAFILALRNDNYELDTDEEIEKDAEDVAKNSDVTKDLKDEDKKKVYSAVKNLFHTNPKIVKRISNDSLETETPPIQNKNRVAITSILANTIGDVNKASKISKSLVKHTSTKDQKKVINKYAPYVLPKSKSENISKNDYIKTANIPKMTDNVNPKHVLEKRKQDFEVNLKEDIKDAFNILKNKNTPMNVTNIKVETIKTPPNELQPTIKDRYHITLKDSDKKDHNIVVELPHLTEEGTFYVNGQKKVIINQFITYPIFFYKPYHGRFTSGYSSLSIHSKILKNASYLMLFAGGYKIPLITYLAYRLGFEQALKLYDVTYTIHKEKVDDGYKLPDNTYISFKWNDEAGKQLVTSFVYSMKNLPEVGFNLSDPITWRKVLENQIGNKNCTYILDQIWTNIVTPIEIKLLESRGDPTTIDKIIRYISKEVVNGRVDDRNSLERQRIRTSELFVAILQKQIHLAYNEYELKKAAGDDSATLKINEKYTYSQVINSQNVQGLENINPLEEISMMTRVTPVGIGGVASPEEYPLKALNIHNTYYGNVDPLESPSGQNIGVQQQLTIGASLTNVRGTFQIKGKNGIVNPAEILSTGPACIPFVESNEGARVTMAAGQAKQAIPLENVEVPSIQTGYETIFTPLLSSSFIKKCPVDSGTIMEVSSNIIQIRDDKTKKIVSVDVTPTILQSGQGKNGLGIYKPVVNVGNKVKKDQILAEGSHIKDGVISTGVNLCAAIMPWRGYNFEDGMVISESAAKKFTSIHVEQQQVYLKEDEDVLTIANMGDTLKKGDILLTYSTEIYDVESQNHLRSDGGTVVNIELYSNVPEEDIPEALIPTYKDFKKRYIALHGSYPIGNFREKGEKFIGILIKFVMSQKLVATRGDKLNNRHFNKGIISTILPDDQMPVTPWGERIEIIYNPLAIINRMISGQIIELHCGMISRQLAIHMEKKSRKDFVDIYTKVMVLLDNTNNKQYSTNMIKWIKSLPDSSYKKLVEKTKNDRFIPLIFPPFQTPKRSDIIAAMKVCGVKSTYPLFLPHYNKKSDPVSVGYIYVSKLEHIAEKKISSRSVGPYVEKTKLPTAGKARGGAQALGEYDIYSLLAWDCPIMVDEFLGPVASDHVVKNEMISQIIQEGDCDFKVSKTNPVKDLFLNMMLAIHLEST